MKIRKVTRKGQVTIPVELRKKHGIEVGDSVVFEEREGQFLIRPISEAQLMETVRKQASDKFREPGPSHNSRTFEQKVLKSLNGEQLFQRFEQDLATYLEMFPEQARGKLVEGMDPYRIEKDSRAGS